MRLPIMPNDGASAPNSARISVDDPRRQRILRGLATNVSSGVADYYQSAIEILAMEKPLPAASHLLSNLGTEIQGAFRTVLVNVAATKLQTLEGESWPPANDTPFRNKKLIHGILIWLGFPTDGPLFNDWNALTGTGDTAFSTQRHRRHLDSPRPIDWESWNLFEGVLDDLLDAFTEKYDLVLDTLDEIAGRSEPTKADAETLRESLPQTENALGHFFNNLDNPKWIGPLNAVGFFATPPKAILTPDGISFPSWAPLRFLARMAGRDAQLTFDIARRLPPTDNVFVHRNMARIAASLPPGLGAHFVDNVDDWLDADARLGTGSELASFLCELAEKLANGGEATACLRVIRALLRPVPGSELSNSEAGGTEPKTRLADWQLQLSLGRLAPIVVALGESGVAMLSELLDEAISIKHGGTSPVWDDYPRVTSIEECSAGPLDNLGDHLVSALRDTVVHLVNSAPEKISEVVTSLESHRSVIFRRIALFLLTQFPEALPQLTVSKILDGALLSPGPYEVEYARLLRRCFARLATQDREAFLSLVHAGPRPSGSDIPGYSVDEADLWRASWLKVISPDLPDDWRARFEDLKTKLGEPRAPDEDTSRVFMGRPEMPFSKEQLALMAPGQMVAIACSLSTDARALRWEIGQAISSIVEEQPQRYATSPDVLLRLDDVFLAWVVSGFDRALRARRRFDWVGVIQLCFEAMASRGQLRGNERVKASDEIGERSNLLQHALWLLSTGLSASHAPIPVEYRQQVWSAIEANLGAIPARPYAQHSTAGDLMSGSRSSLPGAGFRAVIDYAFWLKKNNLTGGLPEEVRKVLERGLADASPVLCAVCGDRLGTLVHLDPAWCKKHVRAIFRERDRRDPAWEIYLEYDRLSLETFKLLVWRYKRAIGFLGRGRPLRDREEKLAKHVASHLGQLFWHGQIGFGGRDGLLDALFTSAPPAITGWLMERIGHWLQGDDIPSASTLDRLKELWKQRAAVGVKEELAAFAWWFASRRFDETWALESFRATLEAGIRAPYVPALADYLVDLLPRHLTEVVSCLELIVKLDEMGWTGLMWQRQARTIVAAALASDDAHARRIGGSVIGRMAAAGSEFRDLRPGARGTTGTTSLT